MCVCVCACVRVRAFVCARFVFVLRVYARDVRSIRGAAVYIVDVRFFLNRTISFGLAGLYKHCDAIVESLITSNKHTLLHSAGS